MAEMQSENYQNGELYQVKVDQLEADPNQPRKYFDEDSLKSLGNSIVKDGVLQPILFRKDGESGKLIIVAGERRVKASLNNNIPEIPGIYFDGDYEEAALVENFCREDLTPIEQADAFQEYKTKKNCSNEDIASLFGKGTSTISEIISLNDLPEAIKSVCRERLDISRRELLKIKRVRDETKQKERFETLVKKYNAIRDDNVPTTTRPDKVDVANRMIDRLTQKLTTIRGGDGWTAGERGRLREKITSLKAELENYGS